MSIWIRQFHRWMAITFMLAVIVNVVVNFVLVGQEQLALWVGLLTLVPLGLLMLSGLYLFVLPYVSSAHRTGW
jgi:hypothetical protein